MHDIMKIVQALEDSNIFPKGVTKTIKNDTEEQKGELLTFKFYLYNSRNKKTPHLQSLLKQINKIKDIEKKLSENNEKKRKIYCKKWQKIEVLLETHF